MAAEHMAANERLPMMSEVLGAFPFGAVAAREVKLQAQRGRTEEGLETGVLETIKLNVRWDGGVRNRGRGTLRCFSRVFEG